MKKTAIEFHTENPHVYDKFKQIALDIIEGRKSRRKGISHYSARGIMHIMRYYDEIRTDDGLGYKVNNDYSPFYARLFVKEFPEYDGFFEMRKSKLD